MSLLQTSESETIQHTLFECSAFEKQRGEFLKRLYELHSVARGLSLEGHCSLLIAYFDTRPKAGIPAVYGGRCPRDEAAQEEEEAAAPARASTLTCSLRQGLTAAKAVRGQKCKAVSRAGIQDIIEVTRT